MKKEPIQFMKKKVLIKMFKRRTFIENCSVNFKLASIEDNDQIVFKLESNDCDVDRVSKNHVLQCN